VSAHQGTFAALRANLTTPRLKAWAGTDRLPRLATRRAALAAQPLTRASAPFALLVAGADVRADWLADCAELVELGLVTIDGELARATLCVLPVRHALVVCDPPEDVSRDAVCWPDDSSEHLASALVPNGGAHWLDLGCGSAYAQLSRPNLVREITGVDLNPRAVRYARLGAELSGISYFTAQQGDLAVPDPLACRCSLVTCNAPIPSVAAPLWRATADATFFPRMLAATRAALAPGGLAVFHAAREALVPLLAELPGERVVVTYTPPAHEPAFCVAWWRPDAPTRLANFARALTAERPHVDAQDYVLASSAAWGSSLQPS
jgi:SAM-dependent methyltransferase